MDITYVIKEKIATLQEKRDGWKKMLCLVSWNGAEPKLDLREWSPDFKKMSRGITLSAEEMDVIVAAMNERGRA